MIKHNYGCKYKVFFEMLIILSLFFDEEGKKKARHPLPGDLATATNGTATLATSLTQGSIAMVKMSNYSIKIVIK